MSRRAYLYRKTLLAVSFTICPFFYVRAQKWDTIDSMEEMETMARNAMHPAIVIAYFVGATFALFTLIKVFKGIRDGDDGVWQIAGGWLAALMVYLFGIWIVNEFIFGSI